MALSCLPPLQLLHFLSAFRKQFLQQTQQISTLLSCLLYFLQYCIIFMFLFSACVSVSLFVCLSVSKVHRCVSVNVHYPYIHKCSFQSFLSFVVFNFLVHVYFLMPCLIFCLSICPYMSVLFVHLSLFTLSLYLIIFSVCYSHLYP